MSDQSVRLGAVLSQLEENRISAADAAKIVRGMTFSAKPAKTAAQVSEDATLPELEEPDSDSFFPVSAAYAGGRISRRQYEALQQAAAASIKARSGSPIPSG